MTFLTPDFRDGLIEFNSRPLAGPMGDDLFGSNDDDVIIGGVLRDVLLGFAGNDRIVANDGDDIAAGDAGEDTVIGGTGNDTLLGGADDDRVDGGAGRDVVYGNEGNDLLLGRGGNDGFVGGEGDDDIRGGGGFDTAYYEGNLLEDGEFQFDFANFGNRIEITDLAGDQGTDMLRSIEAFHFDDVAIDSQQDNNAPIAFDDFAIVNNTGMVSFNVLNNDIDFDIGFLGRPDVLSTNSVTFISGLGSGTLPNTGEFTYDTLNQYDTLGFGETASVVFEYGIIDSFGEADSANIDITVIGGYDGGPVVDGGPVPGQIADNVFFLDGTPGQARYFTVELKAGQSVDIGVNRLETDYDPAFWLVEGLVIDPAAQFGPDGIDSGDTGVLDLFDDEMPADGPFGDPLAEGFVAPSDGFYTIIVTDGISGIESGGDGLFDFEIFARSAEPSTSPGDFITGFGFNKTPILPVDDFGGFFV